MSIEFTAMRTKFGQMFFRVKNSIENCRPSLENLKEFLEFTYSDITSRLSACKTVKDVLSLVKEKCSLINIKLLEGMIEEFQFKEAEQHIQTYKEEIDKFCQTMSARLCLNETFQVTVPHTPLQCETATFVVEGNPDECMLEDIRNLLSVAFERLSLTVNVVVIKKGNSVVIICKFPVNLAMLLVAKAMDNLEILKKKFHLKSLTIGYVRVWNKHEVMKSISDKIIVIFCGRRLKNR